MRDDFTTAQREAAADFSAAEGASFFDDSPFPAERTAGELPDEILHRLRAAGIFLEVDPGFLAQDQTEQCFENASATAGCPSPALPPALLMNSRLGTSG